MSTPDIHDEHSPATAADGHDAHASHEPHDGLDPEEPRTPMWLTGLGIALLVFAGLGYLMVGSSASPAPEATAAQPMAVASDNPPTLRFPPAAGSVPRGIPNLRDLVPAARAPTQVPTR